MFPQPPAGVPVPIAPPPPPEPPFPPAQTSLAPLPPPADVIVENTEFDPFTPGFDELIPPAQPPHTVIRKAVAVTVTLFGALG